MTPASFGHNDVRGDSQRLGVYGVQRPALATPRKEMVKGVALIFSKTVLWKDRIRRRLALCVCVCIALLLIPRSWKLQGNHR
jgi:hypothetical protein